MVGMIYATSPEGVIGANGTIPWRHPGDYRRFKRVTLGSTVIMGRKTFESMGKALEGRRNIVVTRSALAAAGVESAPTIEEALELAKRDLPGSGGSKPAGRDVWFIGGARIYEEGMKYADVIDVTYVPDHVAASDVVRAPVIDEQAFEAGPLVEHEDEPGLTRRVYVRKK
jgi:dihydrofolate reductase